MTQNVLLLSTDPWDAVKIKDLDEVEPSDELIEQGVVSSIGNYYNIYQDERGCRFAVRYM